MEAHSSVLAFRAIDLHDCQKTTSLYAVLQYKVMLDAGSNHANKIMVESIQRRQTGLSFVVHAMLLQVTYRHVSSATYKLSTVLLLLYTDML